MATAHAERRQPIVLRQTNSTLKGNALMSGSFETAVQIPFGRSRSLRIELNSFVADPSPEKATSYWVHIKEQRGKKPVVMEQSRILKHHPGSDISDEVVQLLEKEHLSPVDKFLRSLKL